LFFRGSFIFSTRETLKDLRRYDVKNMTRRDVLTAAGSALSGLTLNGQITGRKKSVIVIGAGIAGLSCAYELVRRGHEVTVLEATGRSAGHVRTLHDPFADGLYADMGAEHFYYPGYQ
jgi:monoamine oxidase